MMHHPVIPTTRRAANATMLEAELNDTTGDVAVQLERLGLKLSGGKDPHTMVAWLGGHSTRGGRVTIKVKDTDHGLAVNALQGDRATTELGQNGIGELQMRTSVPLPCDSHSTDCTPDSFIPIEEATQVIVDAGMINSAS